ncbi:outer membrane protein transport protein [bacterium]|nr:outer membrane protein transport protein [bacterium]
MKKRIFIILSLSLIWLNLYSQDIPFIMGRSWVSGFKAASLGGAFTAVADDYSAGFYNPAGLGQIKKITGGVSIGHLSITNSSTFGGIETTENSSYTGLNSFGIAIPVPTYQGSLVFGINYQKIREFDNSLYVSMLNNAPGDSVQMSYNELEQGSLSAISFSGAIEVAPQVYLGGSVNFWSGNDDYLWRYTESDNVYDIWTFNNYKKTTTINTGYTGLNFTGGILYYLNKNIRFGITAETPLTLTGKEDWSYQEKTLWDDNATTTDSTDNGFTEYKISSPYIFRAGLSIKQGPVMITGSAEFLDYSQIKYKNTGYIEDEEQNVEIRQKYQNVTNLSVGGELALPNTPVILRGGYRINKSPLKHVSSDLDRKIISFGAELKVNDQFSIGCLYQMSSWKNKNQADNNIIEKENIDAKKLSFALIYRGK